MMANLHVVSISIGDDDEPNTSVFQLVGVASLDILIMVRNSSQNVDAKVTFLMIGSPNILAFLFDLRKSRLLNLSHISSKLTILASLFLILLINILLLITFLKINKILFY